MRQQHPWHFEPDKSSAGKKRKPYGFEIHEIKNRKN